MHGDASGLRGITRGDAKVRANRVCDRDMGDAALAEKAVLAGEGAVNELVDDHEIARRHVLLERSAGRDCNDVGHAHALEGVDVGPVRHGGGGMDVAPAVARQERQSQTVQRAGQDCIGRLTEGACDSGPLCALQAVDLVKARAADNPQVSLRRVLGHLSDLNHDWFTSQS